MLCCVPDVRTYRWKESLFCCFYFLFFSFALSRSLYLFFDNLFCVFFFAFWIYVYLLACHCVYAFLPVTELFSFAVFLFKIVIRFRQKSNKEMFSFYSLLIRIQNYVDFRSKDQISYTIFLSLNDGICLFTI